MIFALEMITREPLKIPVFTKKYWATFDDSYSPLPGRDLARILEIVRTTPPKTPLTKTAGLSPARRTQARGRSDQPLDRLRAQESIHLNYNRRPEDQEPLNLLIFLISCDTSSYLTITCP